MSVHHWRASALMLVSALACGNAPVSEEPLGVRDAVAYQLAAAGDAGVGLSIEFCHAGACKVTLAPQFDLDFKVDWSGPSARALRRSRRSLRARRA
jgi:hypothetical protein